VLVAPVHKLFRATGQRRASLRGSPVIAAVVTAVGLSGCGGLAHTVAAADGDAPIVGVDRHLDEAAQWDSPTVSRQADGQFAATLSLDTSSNVGKSNPGPVKVRVDGLGWPRVGNGYGQSYVGPGPLSAWTAGNETYSVALTTNARVVSLIVWSLGGRFQVKVDSLPLGSPELAGATEHHHTLDVEFPTSARRTITYELANGVYFTGLRVGGESRQISLPPTPRPEPPSTYWLGDSYVGGGGATYPGFDDLAHLASTSAGLTDVTVDALGGTGYIKTNEVAHFPNYLARARVNLGPRRAQPRLIVVGGSVNDAVYGEAAVRRAATALYRYLATAVPSARVVVVPFTTAYPVPASIARANGAITEAARAAPNVVGVLDLPERVLALGGTAKAERQSGALESTVVQGHPSEQAHRLFGRIIGSFLADCIRTLRQKGAAPEVCDQAS
jgi:GDSL-like Lipase/Acylhydrolase family